MKPDSIRVRSVAALFLALTASAAQAHPGHGGLLGGITHPLSGADHLAAMVAVGLWASALPGRQRWLLPMAFVTAALLGVLLPASVHALALAEQGIVLSLLVLGGSIVAAMRMPLSTAMVLMTLSGLCHGYAHAAEIPAGESAAAFIAGMMLVTSLLHAAGVFAGAVTKTSAPWLARLWGVPVAIVGLMGLSGV